MSRPEHLTKIWDKPLSATLEGRLLKVDKFKLRRDPKIVIHSSVKFGVWASYPERDYCSAQYKIVELKSEAFFDPHTHSFSVPIRHRGSRLNLAGFLSGCVWSRLHSSASS